MLFEFNRFSSLLLVFFIHGLVYAILLYRKSWIQETRSDKWLSLFLFLCILYIAPWMVGFAGWYDTQPYRDILFYIPFHQLYFIGPVIFFYVQSLLNPSFRFGGKLWWHFAPGFLYLIFSVVIFITDKVVLKRYYFLSNGEDPDFDLWYQVTGFGSMLFYFFLSLRYYSLYKKVIVQVISYAGAVLFRWIRNFLVAFLIMLCLRLIFFIMGQFINLGYWDNWWYFMVFAILFYYIAISGYANSVETKVALRMHLVKYRSELLLNYNPLMKDEPEKEQTESIGLEATENDNTVNPLLEEWKPKLQRLMVEERVYEDPELTLSQVAKQLGTNPSIVSILVNKGFGLNFNDFVNQFRVNAVKSLVEKGEHKRQTLLSIAFECGFNSKATFNRAFKKTTGQSPREFVVAARDEHQSIT